MISIGAGKGLSLEFAASLEQRQRRRVIQVHVLDQGVEISVFEETMQTSVDDELLTAEGGSAMGVVLSANTVEVGEKLALELLVSCMSAAEDARDVKARYANAINLVVGFFVNLTSVATLALSVVRLLLPSRTKIAHSANAVCVGITSR